MFWRRGTGLITLRASVLQKRLLNTRPINNVVIVGSGPAAHTAAIYAARANLSPILYEGFMAGGVASGGQLTTTTDVENFPGFPNGILGPELTDLFRQQSLRFGTRIVTKTIVKITTESNLFHCFAEDENDPCLAKAVIVATGASAKRLGIAGEDKYWQKGISACAVCDGALPLFRNKHLVVIGGGDSAAEEALFLTKYASKVTVLVRRDVLRASHIMADRLRSNPKVNLLWNANAVEAFGDGKKLKSLSVSVSGRLEKLDASGLFYAIGHVPNSKLIEDLKVNLDQTGYIITQGKSSKTNVPGLFAAGDVQDKHYRQAITAAGSGCMAALDASEYLQFHYS